MNKIDIDDEVFEYLQGHAQPLVDTPNDVLRRLLLGERAAKPNQVSEGTMRESSQPAAVDAEMFVRELLAAVFPERMRRRQPYRMMFESDNVLVYCQNFNKQTNHLWYRVNENPWRELRNSRKKAWVCFTNPAEGYAYVIPVEDIERRVERNAWKRPHLEVNVDPATSRWTELDWDLSSYRRSLSP